MNTNAHVPQFSLENFQLFLQTQLAVRKFPLVASIAYSSNFQLESNFYIALYIPQQWLNHLSFQMKLLT